MDFKTNHMQLAILLLLFFIGGSCNAKKDNKLAAGLEHVAPAYDTSRYAIIPFKENQTWLFKNAKPANLSEKEIKDIEILLADAVLEYNKTVKGLEFQIKPLERYKRQLVAVTNQSGEKEVYLNCFCGSWDKWRTQLFAVDGGGSCFFRVKINLSKKRSYDMMVNGPI